MISNYEGGRAIQKVSIFKFSVYSRCLIADDSRLNGLSNEQFIEQCCSVLHFEPTTKYQALADTLKTEALKTLASIVFLEKTKKFAYFLKFFSNIF